MPGGFKYFSFLLGLSLILSSCYFDFSDKKKEKPLKEAKDDKISLDINGKEVEIDSDKLEEEINSTVNKIISEINSSLEDIGKDWEEGEAPELMDHRELKSMLPDQLGWMKQTEHSSEKSGAYAFRVSKAEALYELKDKWIKIELVDLGGMPIARIGLSFLDEVEVDRESKDEYEKTYEKDGNKYNEKYNKKSNEGKITTVFKDRYVLSIEGKNVKMSELENARDKVKTQKLK